MNTIIPSDDERNSFRRSVSTLRSSEISQSTFSSNLSTINNYLLRHKEQCFEPIELSNPAALQALPTDILLHPSFKSGVQSGPPARYFEWTTHYLTAIQESRYCKDVLTVILSHLLSTYQLDTWSDEIKLFTLCLSMEIIMNYGQSNETLAPHQSILSSHSHLFVRLLAPNTYRILSSQQQGLFKRFINHVLYGDAKFVTRVFQDVCQNNEKATNNIRSIEINPQFWSSFLQIPLSEIRDSSIFSTFFHAVSKVIRLPKVVQKDVRQSLIDPLNDCIAFIESIAIEMLKKLQQPTTHPFRIKVFTDPGSQVWLCVPYYLTSPSLEIRQHISSILKRVFDVSSVFAVVRSYIDRSIKLSLEGVTKVMLNFNDLVRMGARTLGIIPSLAELLGNVVVVLFRIESTKTDLVGCGDFWINSFRVLCVMLKSLLRQSKYAEEDELIVTVTVEVLRFAKQLLDHIPQASSLLCPSSDPTKYFITPLNILISPLLVWLKVTDGGLRSRALNTLQRCLEELVQINTNSLDQSNTIRLEAIVHDDKNVRSLIKASERQGLMKRLWKFSKVNIRPLADDPYSLVSNIQPSPERIVCNEPINSINRPSSFVTRPNNSATLKLQPEVIIPIRKISASSSNQSVSSHRSSSPLAPNIEVVVPLRKSPADNRASSVTSNVGRPIASSAVSGQLLKDPIHNTHTQRENMGKLPKRVADRSVNLNDIWDQAEKARSSDNVTRGFPIKITAEKNQAKSHQGKPGSKLNQIRQEMVRESKVMGNVQVNRHTRPIQTTRAPPSMESKFRASSDESSDNDDYPGLNDLANDVKRRTETKIRPRDLESATERLRAKMQSRPATKLLDIPLSSSHPIGRRLKQQGTVQRRQRLFPSVENLERQVLCWDFFTKSLTPKAINGSTSVQYQKIPNSFESVDDYISIWEPLLFLECWQQLLRSKEEITFSDAVDIKLTDVAVVNDFLDMKFMIDLRDSKSSDWGENDIILLWANTDSSAMEVDPLLTVLGVQPPARLNSISLEKPPKSYTLGKIHSISSRQSDGLSEVILRVFLQRDALKFRKHVRPNNSITVLRLFSLTTTYREYAAVVGLGEFPLCQDILKPPKTELSRYLNQPTSQTMKSFNVNEPQAQAILAALGHAKGFTLIQGPPGTGKTKTILGILGAFLSQRPSAVNMSVAGGKPPRILLCAPSNAAVDELVRRVKAGLRNYDGEMFNARIVRVGTADGIHKDVKSVTLDQLVESYLNGEYKNQFSEFQKNVSTASTDREQLLATMTQLKKEKERIQTLIKETEDLELVRQLEMQLKTINTQRYEIGQQLDAAKAKKNENTRLAEAARTKAKMKVLGDAQIVACTLSSAGHDILGKLNQNFDVVIIDEAAQSVELSSLIPLKYGCQRCILVGDPNQLPPTVLSQVAQEYSYEQSLFVRIQNNCPAGVHLLSIQYRMHPKISMFPSRIFYNSKIRDGVTVTSHTRPWHKNSYSGPFQFFNVHGGKERVTKHSLSNDVEAEIALQLYDRICRDNPDINFAGRVGIVTPYKQQLYLLRRKFQNRYGAGVLDHLDINTVDGFQGQEKEIILLSCVRAGGSDRGIGFLSDVRRMNVGLTRAKYSIFVLGHSHSLVKNRYWRELVEYAKAQKLFIDVDIPLLNQPLSRTIPSNALPPQDRNKEQSKNETQQYPSYVRKRSKNDSDGTSDQRTKKRNVS
ncbi:AAA domain-containing protein [Paraphysoderma sedebokerense]|nr:AAA domain-containing protein [Paraphysoderma sedebokerense]